MSAEKAPSSPIELPGLTSSLVDVVSADVRVLTGGTEITQPQLVLEGDDDAFKHSFNRGRLVLNEKSENNSGNLTVVSPGGAQSIVIGGSFSSIVVTGSSSIRVNGREVLGGQESSASTERRRVSLLLPAEHSASHDINSTSGDVELEALRAKLLKVATVSGDIALRGTVAHNLALRTVSGGVEIEDTTSTKQVTARTVSGDIDISGSDAPEWRLSSTSGDIKVKGTEGEVDASSVSGRTRISR